MIFGLLTSLSGIKKLLGPLLIVSIIGGLITAGYMYVKNKDNQIAGLMIQLNEERVIKNQMQNNISVLKAADQEQKNKIQDIKYNKLLIEQQIDNLRRTNKDINDKLRKKEIKIVGRDLQKLKDSRHKELVLKIINKSIKKQFKVFEEKQP